MVVAGGLVAGDQSTAKSYRVDLRNGQATALPDLPVPVHDVGGAVVNGRSEVIGGGNATEQDVVQRASTNSSWRVSGRLPSPRSDLVAVAAGDRVFVVGGYDGTTAALADVLISTSGGPFRIFGQLRVPVRYAAAAVSHGAIWVFGGESGGVELPVIQRIDLHTGRTRVAAQLPGPLGHASAVPLGSRILLIGGRTTASSSSVTAAMWWFRPGIPPTLRRAGTLPFPLSDSALARAGGAAYLVGGESPGLSASVLRITYDRGA
jgi:N-acetylneuraminic acid mutarotase